MKGKMMGERRRVGGCAVSSVLLQLHGQGAQERQLHGVASLTEAHAAQTPNLAYPVELRSWIVAN